MTMLLQRLNEVGYHMEQEAIAQREEVPSGYTQQAIAWIIQLDTQGNLEGVIPTSAERPGKDKGIKLTVPYLRRSGKNIKPQLLADKAEFVLGLPEKDEKRAQIRHCDFVALIQACAERTGEESVRAVVTFLNRNDLRNISASREVSPTELMTFRVENVLPVNLRSVQTFWTRVAPYLGGRGLGELTAELIQAWLMSPQKVAEGDLHWECIVCATPCIPARVHPVAIKLPRSVADQQCSVVTANKNAFYSYGLEQSFIAPTCRPCAERYAKAINRLVEQKETHITIGPLVYLFWTKEPQGFSFASILSDPQPDEVRALIASVFSGRVSDTDIDPRPFYATALSASGGRVVIRDWLETTVGGAKKNLARWFQLQSIIGEWGDLNATPFPIQGFPGQEGKIWVEGLAESVVPRVQGRRDINKVNPNVPKVLLHMALQGGRLPMWLLFHTVQRNQVEQGVTRNRAALIKMVLLSQRPFSASLVHNDANIGVASFAEEHNMVQLDPINRDHAYLCGRLLAVLEAVQRAAIPGVNATITDRFFGTASTAPASVFGRLLRGAQAHLSKLRNERRGTYEALERDLEEVQAGLTAFPKILTPEEQGLFSLGYYHQRAANRAAARAYRQPQEPASENSSSPEVI
jgi:CRISPR-associated protein Csd1